MYFNERKKKAFVMNKKFNTVKQKEDLLFQIQLPPFE